MIMPVDGSKFTVNIGRTATANHFKNAIKQNNMKLAAKHFKSLVLLEGMRLMRNDTRLTEIAKAPIIQMLNDPDWKPEKVAELLYETAKLSVGMAGNALYGLDKLNHQKVDKVLAAMEKLDPAVKEKVENHVGQLVNLYKALDIFGT